MDGGGGERRQCSEQNDHYLARKPNILGMLCSACDVRSFVGSIYLPFIQTLTFSGLGQIQSKAIMN